MRRLQRSALSEREQDWLDKKTAEICKKPEAERKDHATKRWDIDKGNQASNPLGDIQKKLQAMCSGLIRCMYCEDSQGHAIDHFWPKSTYPDRTFVWANLLYACSHCNSNGKRNQFPLDADGQPLLIDPTAENPNTHLLLTPSTGQLQARNLTATGQPSAKGEQSIAVFELNRSELTLGRKDAWHGLLGLIDRYDRACSRSDATDQANLRSAICQHPFSSVLVSLLRIAELPAGQRNPALLSSDDYLALSRRPEIKTWVPV